VIIFPLVKRVGKVRHTAVKLSAKHGDDATLYWKQVVASQRKHLQRVGLSPEEIEAELRSFFDAVQCQMARMVHERYPGGAA
jgi:hypothetical protein